MEKAIKKEVSYSVKEYDFLANASFKEEMRVLRDDINQQFIAQEKLFDSKLSAVESRIFTEFYKSRQEANRWRIASGLAAATLLFGFYEYNEGKLFNKPDKDSTSSALKQ